jgi:hypothetical protein
MEHGIVLDKEVGLEQDMTRRRWRWKTGCDVAYL